MRNIYLAAATGGVILSALGASAVAQTADTDRNVTVRERQRPEVQALGIRTGSFTMLPALVAEVQSDSNVFVSDTNAQSDVIISYRPSLNVNSNWSRHSLSASVSGEYRDYQDFSSDDQTNYNAQLRGRLDIGSSSSLNANVGTGQFHDTRAYLIDPTNASEPPEGKLTSGGVGGSTTLNRIRLSANYDVVTYDFQNIRNANGSTVNQDLRDNESRTAIGTAEYLLSPATTLFVQLRHNSLSYDLNPVGTPSRDSTGYEALVGANLQLTNLLRGSIGVGYVTQTFDNNAVEDLSGASVRGDLNYFLSPITTVKGYARRAVEASFTPGSPADLVTNFGIGVDHELLRNLIISAQASGYSREFSGIDRDDERTLFGVSADYLMNRIVHVGISVEQEKQTSDGVDGGPDYDITSGRLWVKFQR